MLIGIQIGEIGSKLGMNSTNNGFLAFDNVRIPRMHMLMKNAQVLKVNNFICKNITIFLINAFSKILKTLHNKCKLIETKYFITTKF